MEGNIYLKTLLLNICFTSIRKISLKRIFITDINGRLIKEITPQNVAQYEVSFNGASGVYLLNVVGENEKRTMKIIKQ